jgi:hypothetical protein
MGGMRRLEAAPTDSNVPIRDIQEFQPNGGCNTESGRSTIELTSAR